MTKPTIYKIILGLLLAAAIALGLLQRSKDPFSQNTALKSSGVSSGDFESYIKRAQELVDKTPSESVVTFLAVGDIMLSRNVAGAIKKSGDANLPFKNMAETLKATDFNFGNLESPILPTGIIGGHSMIFAAPENYISGLKNYGFEILNLANNHAMDQDLKGLNYTQSVLDGMNIKHVGTGGSLKEVWQPAIVENGGIKICFVGASYASVNDSGKTKNNYVARIEDLENLKSAIVISKSECDFIVVTMHAGTEYTRKPNRAQTNFAHAAIDYGADMVIGAHPHWIQTIEKYNSSPPHPYCKKSSFDSQITGENAENKNPLDLGNGCGGKYIFYSLGNFIFDQEWSQETKEGLALKIQLSKNNSLNNLQGPKLPALLNSIELIPVILENYSTPRLANETETNKILNKINQSSVLLK